MLLGDKLQVALTVEHPMGTFPAFDCVLKPLTDVEQVDYNAEEAEVYAAWPMGSRCHARW